MKTQDWKRTIDRWFTLNHLEPIPWAETVAFEGGRDASKMRAMQDALRMAGTSHQRWYQSGQLWTGFYNEPRYIYSLLACFDTISRPVYSKIGHLEAGKAVVDVGGSIFTSHRLLEFGVKSVIMTNFSDSPQVDFARWVINEYGLPIEVVADDQIPKHAIIVTSEYLEHFRNVDAEIDRLSSFSPVRWYDKNWLCGAAYGHYIPVIIEGQPWFSMKPAREALTRRIMALGYSIERVPVYNRSTFLFTPQRGTQ